MNRVLFTISFVFVITSIYGQLAIPGTTIFKAGTNTSITTNANVENTSTGFDLSGRGNSLNFVGTNQGLSTSNAISIPTISTVAGGTKSVRGKVIITSNLNLGGNLTTSTSLTLDQLTIASGASISGAASDAYIVGTLVHQGGGDKFFPIGTANQYMPVTLLSVNGTSDLEIAVLGSTQSSSTTPPALPEEVNQVSQNWVWRYTSTGLAGATPQLPVLDADLPLVEGTDIQGVVVNLDGGTNVATNLGGVVNNRTITGGLAFPGPEGSLMIGNSLVITPLIHNLITLNNDSENDFLVIENIDIYPANEVILLDRWGTEVYRRRGFLNFDDLSNPYDGSLDFLEPGNYICLVKYAGRTAKQVITVLK